jgi:hypothetical protein
VRDLVGGGFFYFLQSSLLCHLPWVNSHRTVFAV